LKKAILTIVCGEKYQKIWQRSEPFFHAYAEKCDAELIVLQDASRVPSAHWLKFSIHELLKKEFDRIAFIDADIIIRPDTPSLFDIVPEEYFGIFNEGYYTQRSICLHEVKSVYKVDLPGWNGKDYYNTGVMVCSKRHRHIFKINDPIKPLRNAYGEQTYLNMRIIQSETKIYNLDPDYNRMCLMDRITGMTRLNSYIIHYAGFDILFGEGKTLEAMDRDIKKWAEDAPNYKYTRKIFIWSFGGMGDCISSEPVVRFIRNVAYKDADIYLMTKDPEIYDHILGIELSNEYPKNDFDAIYEFNTHFIDHGQFHAIVPHALAHPIDWISMATVGRQLTNDQKETQLTYSPEHLEEVLNIYDTPEELVLIHAGRGWETKTFPVDWWESVIKGIQGLGLKVGLIGREMNEKHGYVPVDSKDCIDFRDKLSTKGLFALIDSAKILVTNDSLPVHIGGAFDNYIILLPVPKHPDHLLPFRKGSQYYKAKALYKRLLDDDHCVTPTAALGWKLGGWQVGSFMPDKKIEDYICTPEEVIDAVSDFNSQYEQDSYWKNKRKENDYERKVCSKTATSGVNVMESYQ